MLKLAIVLVLCLSVVLVLGAPSECGLCDRERCVLQRHCVSGTVLDHCGCCEVCGLAEHEQCNVLGVDSTCGHNMTCVALPEPSTASRCVCDYPTEMCGTDGQTYRNICHMKEIREAEGLVDLNVAKTGPCVRQPKLVSGPSHVTNHSGGSIALSCEADGFPIPTIDWLYTRSDGKVTYLPGDSGDISVNLRGGPERHQITGWIQIQNLVKDHEGDYMCMAHNGEGRVEGLARVLVRG